MILLNHDFSAIIMGIEEGRNIFDNLKKYIAAYALTYYIPELIFFLAFNTVQITLQHSTVLILCVVLGNDIMPAVAFSYDDTELTSCQQTKCQTRTFVHSKYDAVLLQLDGITQNCAGFVPYCIAMHDYGMIVYDLFCVTLKVYYTHSTSDGHDPTDPRKGSNNVEKRPDPENGGKER